MCQIDEKSYLTIKACAMRVSVGSDINVIKVLQEIDENCQIIVFPELCLTGATCGDAFLQSTLLNYVNKSIEEIVRKSETIDSMLFVGAPIKVKENVYDCVVVIQKGKILGVVPKTAPANPFAPAPLRKNKIKLLGQDVVFDKKAIFALNQNSDVKIGVEIGSDSELIIPPSKKLIKMGANVIVNPSVSKMLPTREKEVEETLAFCSQNCVYIRAENSGGESTTDCLFDGQNFVFINGKLLKKSIPFNNFSIIERVLLEKYSTEKMTAKRLKNKEKIRKNPFLPTCEIEEFCTTTFEIQARGLATRLSMIPGVAKAIIGLSGGLDSCLALLVINRAFEFLNQDKKKIIAISMPCFGTSKRTKSNAQKLAERLGVTFREISIKDSVLSHFNDIGHDQNVTDATYENAQARERTQVLMDLSNKEGGMVIGTGDLSELALGWATYNGDQMSMYGVNASIPKTMVRQIVKVYAQKCEGELKDILLDILATPVSPELLPPKDDEIAQVTEDIIGPYQLHDFFLYYMLVDKLSPVQIFDAACKVFASEYKKELIYGCLNKFIRRFFAQQFKRSCMPDGIQATKVSLSPRGGLSLPSDMSNALWLKQLEQIKI